MHTKPCHSSMCTTHIQFRASVVFDILALYKLHIIIVVVVVIVLHGLFPFVLPAVIDE